MSLASTPDAEILIYPESLLPDERRQISRLMVGVSNPQLVLDELAGQMARGQGHVKSTIGYLTRLIQNQAKGEFVAEFGYRVANARKRREELLAQRRQYEPEAQSQPTDRAEARARMASLLAMVNGRTQA